MNEQMILSLSKKSTENILSLQEVFCASMKNKVALVSGGATGLGYNTVNRLAEAGARVVIASRSEIKGDKAVVEFREKGYDVSFVPTDVTNAKDCYAAVDYTVKKYGKVDIVVANAAGWSSYAFLDMPESEFDRVLDTGLKGAYFIAQAAARFMVKTRTPGKIIFISSAAHLGLTLPHINMMTHYNAAKGGVVSMTKGIAAELKQYGINVNCVAPGGMLSAGAITEGGEVGGLYGKEYLESRKNHSSETPLAQNPDMVALAVYGMCTPMSDFMFGETVNVNGGAALSFQEKPFSYSIEGCVPGPSK